MPITYLKTSIFDSPADTLVNPVNCVGVMGAGLAKEFKRRFPEMFCVYQKYCKIGSMRVGEPIPIYVIECDDLNGRARNIVLFPTKHHWKNQSTLDGIKRGLTAMLPLPHLGSLSFPRLGCGLGGLDWSRAVRPMMEEILSGYRGDVYIHDI